jgi:hypothetical protein
MTTLIGATNRSESGNGIHKDLKLTFSAMVCSVTTGWTEASRSMPAGVRNDDDEGSPCTNSFEWAARCVDAELLVDSVTTEVDGGEEMDSGKNRGWVTRVGRNIHHGSWASHDWRDLFCITWVVMYIYIT